MKDPDEFITPELSLLNHLQRDRERKKNMIKYINI